MQISIIVDLSGESLERQMEMVQQALKLTKEMEEKFGTSEEKAPERAEVTPEALEEHLKTERRQAERDRERVAMAREFPGIGV